MPITKSAKKALKQSNKRHTRNVRKKDAYKAVVKEFKNAIIAKDFDKAKSMLPKVYKKLDKAAKTNTIDKNKSSRTKSRLTKHLYKSVAQ